MISKHTTINTYKQIIWLSKKKNSSTSENYICGVECKQGFYDNFRSRKHWWLYIFSLYIGTCKFLGKPWFRGSVALCSSCLYYFFSRWLGTQKRDYITIDTNFCWRRMLLKKEKQETVWSFDTQLRLFTFSWLLTWQKCNTERVNHIQSTNKLIETPDLF